MISKAYKIALIILLCLAGTSSFAQRFDIEYQQCLGGSGGDWGKQILINEDSTYILSGMTTSNDGVVSGNHGEDDFWLVNIDPLGNILWQKPFGGSDSDVVESMAIGSNGSYIMFGSTQSNDGDVSDNHGGIDYWVMKADNTGILLWQRCLGSSVNDYPIQMKLDHDNNIFLIGYSLGSDGDISDPRGLFDMWVVKLDQNGNIFWEKSLGGADIDYGLSVLPTPDGGYLAGGLTTSTDGDVSCTTSAIFNSEMWLIKLDSMNNTEWDHCYGGSYDETVYDMIQTEDLGYLIVGGTNSDDGDVSGFHGVPGGEFMDIWLLKIDSVGILEWQKCFGGTNREGNAHITSAENGEYYINCYTESNDGDVSGNHSDYYPDIWLTKINLEGELLWQQCFGSTNGEATAGILPHNDMELMIVSGTSKADGDVDCELFHPGIPSDSDLWIFKIYDTLSVTSPEYRIEPSTIIIYPNPASDIIYYYIKEKLHDPTLFVYNVYGQKAGEYKLEKHQNQIEIDVSNFISGVYLAVLYSDHKIVDRRQFVVK